PFILVGAFFLGLFMSRIVGRLLSGSGGAPAWFQDFQAWIALLAAVGLTVVIIVLFVINPGLAKEKQLDSPVLHNFLAAIISFYFAMSSEQGDGEVCEWNDEGPMTKKCRIPNDEQRLRVSSFVLSTSFEHSSFEPRHLRPSHLTTQQPDISGQKSQE